ncbi:hypothetical protein [Deinococcus yunweiensis]|uniref:hypothetical protein n=1 Tax=Deinococcus yunweiensis TaxID=367282 RepID=UPI00398F474B
MYRDSLIPLSAVRLDGTLLTLPETALNVQELTVGQVIPRAHLFWKQDLSTVSTVIYVVLFPALWLLLWNLELYSTVLWLSLLGYRHHTTSRLARPQCRPTSRSSGRRMRPRTFYSVHGVR